jgi:hypothetical protein
MMMGSHPARKNQGREQAALNRSTLIWHLAFGEKTRKRMFVHISSPFLRKIIQKRLEFRFFALSLHPTNHFRI